MPLSALGLLLGAAILHATWNLLVKRAKEKYILTWWALIVGVVCYAPLLLAGPWPLWRIWPYVLSSGFVEAIYFMLLIRAYQHGDFSLVYPMARGMAPAFLVVWAVLFLSERPSLFGFIGLALLVLGLVVVGGKVWWSLRKTAVLSTNALAMALAVACSISVYTTIDGAAVRIVSPLPYTVLIMAVAAVFVTPAVLLRYGRRAIIAEWRTSWLNIMLVGIFNLLTYLLVLKAYSIARVSYAGAIREMSVVFVAFLGWRLLGEDFGAIRVIGSIFIFAGILVIAVAG